jgi:hypothetical protein
MIDDPWAKIECALERFVSIDTCAQPIFKPLCRVLTEDLYGVAMALEL